VRADLLGARVEPLGMDDTELAGRENGPMKNGRYCPEREPQPVAIFAVKIR
jgi:hypothetical protein